MSHDDWGHPLVDVAEGVSDLVDKLRWEYHQLGGMETINPEDYILPPWESINILQSGDLVKVIRSRHGAEKRTTQKSVIRRTL